MNRRSKHPLPIPKNRSTDFSNRADVKKTGWIFILLILSAAAYGQYKDTQLWSGISIRYDPGKKWKISLEEEARFFENISRLDKINSELDINYQVNKLLDGGILYRLISNRKNGGLFEFNHRFGAYLEAQKKISGWACLLKAAFQKTYPDFMHTDDWYIPEYYVRVLAEVSRELKNKRTEPYTNIEFWYRTPAGEQAFIDQCRWTIGIKHNLNKSSRLDFFYRLQHEMQVKHPLTANIIGIGYRFRIR